MTLYAISLFVHSYLRWLVVALVIAVGVRSFVAWRAGRSWDAADGRLQKAMLGVVDTQFTLGVLLYLFLSPFRRALFADFRHAVHEAAPRFFGMEHPLAMLVAVAVLHIGSRTKAAPTAGVRHRRRWVTSVIATLIVVGSIPWPGLPHGRPLFRGFGALASPPDTASPAARCPPVFASRCAVCHGVAGRGDGLASASLKPPPRDFSKSDWAAQRSDDDLRAVIRGGGHARGLSAAMPAHVDLPDEVVDELVRCVRDLGEGG